MKYIKTDDERYKYIEDITKTSFQQIKGGGKGVWLEFVKLRGY